MDASEMARLRDMLIGMREEVAARSARIEAELRELVGSRADANDDDEHDPEGVTLSAEWSRLAGLSTQATEELDEVRQALERWESGEYGICTSCGNAIPFERLEVRPFAAQCVACASARR